MFPLLLEKIALALDQLRIPYMLVGGQAVLLHGEPRLTRDIDITLGVGPERVADILKLAGQEGWKILVNSPDEFVARSMVLPCLDEATGIRIDFIFSFSPYERQACERAQWVPIGKARVPFVTPEDLVVHKIVAGRARDLEDARGIMLKNPNIDTKYIHHWLDEFDHSLNERFVERFEALRK